ncbi:MAG: hypothetical protein M0Z95_04430 [Actinomycetota bacterium]|nr:hypothetical protein [Actinomycetota bacterium]
MNTDVIPLADRDAIRRHVAIGAALLEAIEAMRGGMGFEQQVDAAVRALLEALREDGYEIAALAPEADR